MQSIVPFPGPFHLVLDHNCQFSEELILHSIAVIGSTSLNRMAEGRLSEEAAY